MDWSETVQGFVLGSFFYGYATTQVGAVMVTNIIENFIKYLPPLYTNARRIILKLSQLSIHKTAK